MQINASINSRPRFIVGLGVAALLAGLALQAPAEAATRAGSPALVFASFNICKTDCAAPAPAWDIRREESGPDDRRVIR
ncbi:MAG: hypothetical protein HQ453_00795 [Actinobacteria bacterium]|nr:hypothetical protein [Actinomycetota bacterium]